MSQALLSLRRRAAVAVLGSRLDEAALVQELWFQHDSMRGEAVSDIIAFVDAVANRHLFDAATRKRLYSELFQALKQAPDTLPLDPWPGMQAQRAPAGPALRAVAAPVAPPPPAPVVTVASLQPVAAALAAVGVAASVPVGAPAAPAAAALDGAPPVVFGAVLRGVVAEVQRFHQEALVEVGQDALAGLADVAIAPSAAQAFRAAWPRALQHDWQLPASAADLAALTRVVYLALGSAFGRVGADQILQRAISAAEDLPEAREFSPKRLLAAL